MNPVDISIIVIILVSLLIGVFRGFIREILSLASWIIALFIAWTFAELGATYLEPYVSQPPLRVAGAFVAIFIIVLIALSIVSYLLYKLIAMAGIGGVDRSLGAIFGIARGIAIVAALILGAIYMDFSTQPWWQGTKLVQYFSPVTDFMLSFMPENIVEHFKPKSSA